MARYIDADAIHEKYDRYANHSPFGRGHGKTLARFLDWIDEEPTADVVEIVKCKDCMHSEIDKYAPAECQNRCKLSQLYHEPTFFCKCGEPRTDLLEWIHRGDDDEQGV